MGKGIEWTQANFAKNWMQVCKGFAGCLPFLSQTLWQVGPMPWLMGGNGWFNNTAWGNIGDSFIHKNSGTETESGTPEVEETRTPEEIRAANEKVAKERAEIKKLVENYKKMYALLEEYAKTLSDSTTPKKIEFEELIKQYPETLSERDSKETLTKQTENLKAVFNQYETEIQTNSRNAARKEVAAANKPEYAKHVTVLSQAIASPSKTSGILDENNKLDADIDIIELISAYNSTDSTKTSHIMKAIGSKYQVADGATKSKYETLVNALHNSLAKKAESFVEEELSETTSKLLQNAIKEFEMFDTIQKRFPSDEQAHGENYSNAFDNLYRAIRIAQTELADSKLKEQFDFLDNENPFNNPQLTTKAKIDLQSEGLKDALKVDEPKLSPTDKALEGGYTHTVNERVYKKGDKFYYYDEASEVFKDLEGVTGVNKDGTVIKNGRNVSLDNAINPPDNTGTHEVKVENVDNIASDMANSLNAGRKGREAFVQMLHDEKQFNKDTVITIIDECKKKGITNIIEKMYYLYGADNCNRVVKAVMRKAHDLNLDSSTEFQDLWNYFEAKGKFLYNDDGTIAKADTFEFTTYNQSWLSKDTYENDVQQRRYDYTNIGKMLNKLIAKIKETEKSASGEQ